jgi:ABC-type transport system involved in cytochrome c biogenesis permease subunit
VYWLVAAFIHQNANLIQKARRPMIRVLLICFAILWAQPAQADTRLGGVDYDALAKIPVLHEGRIKPLDTFARKYLQGIYGRKSLPDMTALEWLTMTMFDIDEAYKMPVFRVKNPDVVSFYGLSKKDQPIYTYNEIADGVVRQFSALDVIYKMRANQRSLIEEQALDVYLKMNDYLDISRSFTLLLPDFVTLSKESAAKVGLPAGQSLTYMQVIKQINEIKPIVLTLLQDAGGTAKLNQADKELVILAAQLKSMDTDKRTQLVRVVPPQWGDEEWSSPWSLLRRGQGSPQSAEFLDMWQGLAASYRSGKAVQNFADMIRYSSVKMAGDKLDEYKIKLEVFYSKYDLFTYSLVCYIASLLLMVGFGIWNKNFFYSAAIGVFTFSFIMHVSGLLLRMVIMDRPPVTTLYESVLFVGVVVALTALLVELKVKNSITLAVGAFVASILHFLGFGYEDNGDTMRMLEAVLDTNFWLATHVVSITIGYGLCLVAGTMAHVDVWWRISGTGTDEKINSLHKHLLGVSLVALLFTTLGTILGGVWADQSWGRFWGWDPKENGAMLITLWLIFLLHGRITGVLRKRSFAALMVITNIIVALAWFGVNLLNVGLHSYGFTQNIAMNLGVFCAIEILVSLSPYLIRRKV